MAGRSSQSTWLFRGISSTAPGQERHRPLDPLGGDVLVQQRRLQQRRAPCGGSGSGPAAPPAAPARRWRWPGSSPAWPAGSPRALAAWGVGLEHRVGQGLQQVQRRHREVARHQGGGQGFRAAGRRCTSRRSGARLLRRVGRPGPFPGRWGGSGAPLLRLEPVFAQGPELALPGLAHGAARGGCGARPPPGPPRRRCPGRW